MHGYLGMFVNVRTEFTFDEGGTVILHPSMQSFRGVSPLRE